MASPADRFTRMQKLAIFLIALGQERTREILADVDLNTVEHLNAAIRDLGPVSAAEKASVMLEFARFFYGDQGLAELGQEPDASDAVPPPPPAAAGSRASARRRDRQQPHQDTGGEGDADWVLPAAGDGDSGPDQTEEERAILSTLETLRRRLDPGDIDWGRAGYDFGDGFKGPDQPRR